MVSPEQRPERGTPRGLRRLLPEFAADQRTQGQILTLTITLTLSLAGLLVSLPEDVPEGLGISVFALATVASCVMVQADALAGEEAKPKERRWALALSVGMIGLGLASDGTDRTALAGLGTVMLGVAVASWVPAIQPSGFWTAAEIPKGAGRIIAVPVSFVGVLAVLFAIRLLLSLVPGIG